MNSPHPAALDEPEEILFQGRPALVPSAFVLIIAILTLGLWLLVRKWQVLSVHYKITTRRVVVESGVLSKRLEQVDLYRVTDYSVERPLLQRMMGTGNITLETVERANPQVNLAQLKTDVVALYERIRTATERDRARHGVRMVDYE